MASRSLTLLPPFRCGHPRSDDNLKPSVDGFVCRTCARASSRRHGRKTQRDRKRYLPVAVEGARAKLMKLENEARELGMIELLRNLKHVNREWDKTIKRAQVAAESQGGSIGFGEARRGVDER